MIERHETLHYKIIYIHALFLSFFVYKYYKVNRYIILYIYMYKSIDIYNIYTVL